MQICYIFELQLQRKERKGNTTEKEETGQEKVASGRGVIHRGFTRLLNMLVIRVGSRIPVPVGEL